MGSELNGGSGECVAVEFDLSGERNIFGNAVHFEIAADVVSVVGLLYTGADEFRCRIGFDLEEIGTL